MRSMYRATRVCLCELTNASLMGQIEQARRPASKPSWNRVLRSLVTPLIHPEDSFLHLAEVLAGFIEVNNFPGCRVRRLANPIRALVLKQAKSPLETWFIKVNIFYFPATWRGQLAAFCCRSC
jgi:hypothetical protein